MFSRATNIFVSLYATAAGLVLITYLILTEQARNKVGGESVSPALALLFTACFLSFGPAVVLEGQRRIARLGLIVGIVPVGAERRNFPHACLVASFGIVTTIFAWLPTNQIARYGAFPMPGQVERAVYWLVSSAVIFLCAHGIYVAYRFLRVAHYFGRDLDGALSALTQEDYETSFSSCHVFVSWAFSGVGAFQLPILLLFRRALPVQSQVTAVAFILTLIFVGSFLFWLPRHWQRRRLLEEAAHIVRQVAAGAPTVLLEKLPAYDFWMQRLKTTGLSLTAPAICIAAVTRYENFKPVITAVRALL